MLKFSTESIGLNQQLPHFFNTNNLSILPKIWVETNRPIYIVYTCMAKSFYSVLPGHMCTQPYVYLSVVCFEKGPVNWVTPVAFCLLSLVRSFVGSLGPAKGFFGP